MKMAYAAWTKGTAALVLNVRALAREAGLEAALLADWDESIPHLREHVAPGRPLRRGQGLALGRRDGGDRRRPSPPPAFPTGSTSPPRSCSAARRGWTTPRADEATLDAVLRAIAGS